MPRFSRVHGTYHSLSPAPPQHLPSCCCRLQLQHFQRDVTWVDLYTSPANTSNVEQVGQMTKHIMGPEKKKSGHDIGSHAAYSGDGWLNGVNEMMCRLDYADLMFDYKNKYVLKVYLHNKTQYCLIVSFVSRQLWTENQDQTGTAPKKKTNSSSHSGLLEISTERKLGKEIQLRPREHIAKVLVLCSNSQIKYRQI